MGIKTYVHVPKFRIRIVDIPWRSNKSNIDCGIYVMRHMQTYMGLVSDYHCGLDLDNVSTSSLKYYVVFFEIVLYVLPLPM